MIVFIKLVPREPQDVLAVVLGPNTGRHRPLGTMADLVRKIIFFFILFYNYFAECEIGVK